MAASALPAYAKTSEFIFLQDLPAAEAALKEVVTGPIGFDTEFSDPVLRWDENGQLLPPTSVWDTYRLGVVQVAVPGKVFIVAVKKMKAVPDHLKRILKAEEIAKAGVGLNMDGKILYEAIGENIVIRNFVDVGLITKFGNIEGYINENQTPLGLETCVADVLHQKLDKSQSSVYRWDGEINDAQKLYAGLDAQASLEVYLAAKPRLVAKALQIGKDIRQDWYTFDCRGGVPTRLVMSRRGHYLPWAPKFCPWYQSGHFHGYDY
ncbi:ribonuclease H-like domain-containing protein [Mycena vitilis]|nr:ribonuclease H-like domain-containing protein [Mycena vitilis]